MQRALITIMMAPVSSCSVYCAILHLENKYSENKKLFPSKIYYCILTAMICLLGCCSAYSVCEASVSYFAAAKLLVTYVLLSIAAVYDYGSKKIPNYIPLTLVCISAAILGSEFILSDNAMAFLLSSILGSLLSMIVLYIASKLSKGGIGYGDIKLFGAVGFSVGYYAVFTVLILSTLLCFLFAAPLLFTKKKNLRGDLPFAPFIYAAYTAVLILSLY